MYRKKPSVITGSNITPIKNTYLMYFPLFLAGDEPEPIELTHLNVEAAMMCLASKVRLLCGKANSPTLSARTFRFKELDSKMLMSTSTSSFSMSNSAANSGNGNSTSSNNNKQNSSDATVSVKIQKVSQKI